jgi:hypothetical protein
VLARDKDVFEHIVILPRVKKPATRGGLLTALVI